MMPRWFHRWNPETSVISAIELTGTIDFRGMFAPMKTLRKFLKDESGATAIEYGLIAAGISLAIIAVVNGLGTSLKTKFTSISSSLK
jgi:pilus assembly protein Flp/PilA